MRRAQPTGAFLEILQAEHDARLELDVHPIAAANPAPVIATAVETRPAERPQWRAEQMIAADTGGRTAA